MSILDKVQFWKKKDPLESLNLGTTLPPMEGLPNNDPFSSFTPDNHQSFDPGLNNQNPHMDMPSNQFQNPSFSQAYDPYELRKQSSAPTSSATMDALHNKDIELILSRLDLIKSQLETLNQRMAIVEREVAPKRDSGW